MKHDITSMVTQNYLQNGDDQVHHYGEHRQRELQPGPADDREVGQERPKQPWQHAHQRSIATHHLRVLPSLLGQGKLASICAFHTGTDALMIDSQISEACRPFNIAASCTSDSDPLPLSCR